MSDLLLTEVKIPPIICKLKVFEPARIFAACGAEVLREKQRLMIAIAKVPHGVNANTVFEALKAHPDIEWVEYEERGTVEGDYFDTADPLISNGWWQQHRLGLHHAWKITKGDPSILYVVIDTGVLWYYDEHPYPSIENPRFRLATCPPEFQWNSYYDIPDATLPDHPVEMPQHTNTMRHGTSVWLGLCGFNSHDMFAPNCSRGFVAAAPTGVDGCDPTSMIDGIYKAMEWGATYNKKVLISISWRWFGMGTEWANAINYAWNNGGLVFASAGNNGAYVESYQTYPMAPCNYPNVQCIGGFSGEKIPWGNYGHRVDMIMPYWSVDGLGTSYSSPKAMVAAAMVWSANPALTNAQVVQILREESDPMRLYPYGSYAHFYPYAGVLRLDRAVKRAASMKAENAGVIFPHVQFRAADREDCQTTDMHRFHPVRDGQAFGKPSTTVEQRLTGVVSADVGGYCTDPITNVELKIGTQTVYSGAPGTIVFDTSRYVGGSVSITVTTANDEVTETYSDIFLPTGGIQIGPITLRPYEYGSYIGPQSSYALRMRVPSSSYTYATSAITSQIPLGEPTDEYPLRIRTSEGIKAVMHSPKIPFDVYVRALRPQSWFRFGLRYNTWNFTDHGKLPGWPYQYTSPNTMGNIAFDQTGPTQISDGDKAVYLDGASALRIGGWGYYNYYNFALGRPGTFLLWVKGSFSTSHPNTLIDATNNYESWQNTVKNTFKLVNGGTDVWTIEYEGLPCDDVAGQPVAGTPYHSSWSCNTINDGEWHLLMFTMAADGTRTAYMDGVALTDSIADPTTSSHPGTGSTTIGNSDDESDVGLVGYVDEFVWIARCLSDREALSLWDGKPRVLVDPPT